MKDNIYLYQWKGIKSGWDFLLAVYRADSSNLANKDILNPLDKSKINTANTNLKYLPYGCCDPKKLEMEFEKYPIGVPATPIFTLTWYMKEIPATADFADFEEAVFHPITEIQGEIPFLQFSEPLSFTMTSGTVYRLFIKCNGNAETAVNIYREFFTGIQRSGIDDEDNDWDLSTDEISIKIEHYVPVISELDTGIMQSIISGLELYYYNNPSDERLSRRSCIDFLYQKGGKNYLIGQVAGKDTNELLGFSQMKALFIDILNSFAQSAFKASLRDADASCTWDYPVVRYYKQKYTGDGSRGALLDYSDIYILSSAPGANGFLHPTADLSYSEAYPHGMKDFYTDIFEDSLHKAIYITASGTQGLNAASIFGSTYISGTVTEIVLDKKKCDSLKVKLSNETLRTVTSSLYEHLSEGDYKDREKAEETNKGSRNQIGFTVPIVFNNMPAKHEYKALKDLGISNDTFNEKSPSFARAHYYYHIRKLYYFDKPTLLKDDSEAMPFRVHENCETYIGGFTTDDIIEIQPFNIADDKYNIEDKYNTIECCTDMQNITCKPRIQAKSLIKIFGDINLAKLTVEAPYNEGVAFSAGGNVGWFWIDMSTKYIYDLFTEKSVLNYLPKVDGHNKWIPTKVSIDFDKETADLEMKLQTQIPDGD